MNLPAELTAECLAGVDRVQVYAWPTRLRRLHRRARNALLEAGLELFVESPNQPRHLLRGVHRQAGHAAVAHPSDRGQLEPVHPAVANAHPLRIERLGDDDIALAGVGQPTAGAQPASRSSTRYRHKRPQPTWSPPTNRRRISGRPSTRYRKSCGSSSSFRTWKNTTSARWPGCSICPRAPSSRACFSRDSV